MQEKNQYGSLYIIKYGKVIEIPNIQSADEVRSGKRMPSEIELIAELLNISEEKAAEFDYSQDSLAFQTLLDNGYSIIRTFRSNDDDEINNVLLGNSISYMDYKLIADIEEKIVDNKLSDDSNTHIYNRTINEYGVETEYVEQNNQIRSGRINQSYSNNEMILIMGLLMKEKLNDLDIPEREILKRYRTFDFEKLLTEDNSMDLLHNGNAGMIVVTPDKQVGSTCKSMQHLFQARTIFKNLYAEDYVPHLSIGKTENHEDIDGSMYFKSILIQLMNIGDDAYSIVYLPDRINEFQFKNVQELACRIIDMKEKYNKNFLMLVQHDKLKDETELISSPEETLEFLNSRREELVDDSIQGLKYTKQKEAKKISYKKVCSITKTELSFDDQLKIEFKEYAEQKEQTSQQIRATKEAVEKTTINKENTIDIGEKNG